MHDAYKPLLDAEFAEIGPGGIIVFGDARKALSWLIDQLGDTGSKSFGSIYSRRALEIVIPPDSEPTILWANKQFSHMGTALQTLCIFAWWGFTPRPAVHSPDALPRGLPPRPPPPLGFLQLMADAYLKRKR